MRERVGNSKKATISSFSISRLRQPIRGLGLESSQMAQAVPQQQALNKPKSYDLSRISMRPQAKLKINQPGDVYEQEADRVASQVMQRMSEFGNQQSIQGKNLPEQEEELQTKSLANSTIQRLLYKTTNTKVNIDDLSFARVFRLPEKTRSHSYPTGTDYHSSRRFLCIATASPCQINRPTKLEKSYLNCSFPTAGTGFKTTTTSTSTAVNSVGIFKFK